MESTSGWKHPDLNDGFVPGLEGNDLKVVLTLIPVVQKLCVMLCHSFGFSLGQHQPVMIATERSFASQYGMACHGGLQPMNAFLSGASYL